MSAANLMKSLRYVMAEAREYRYAVLQKEIDALEDLTSEDRAELQALIDRWKPEPKESA